MCIMDKFIADHWHWKGVDMYMIWLNNFVCYMYVFCLVHSLWGRMKDELP